MILKPFSLNQHIGEAPNCVNWAWTLLDNILALCIYIVQQWNWVFVFVFINSLTIGFSHKINNVLNNLLFPQSTTFLAKVVAFGTQYNKTCDGFHFPGQHLAEGLSICCIWPARLCPWRCSFISLILTLFSNMTWPWQRSIGGGVQHHIFPDHHPQMIGDDELQGLVTFIFPTLYLLLS